MTKNPSKKKWFIDNVVSLGLALLLVLAIRSSVIEAFKIPSGSMIPTLLIGDQIFVNKMSYGLKLPFSDWIGSKPIYLIQGSAPERGEIIVFKYPVDDSLYFIKRIVGIPGDTVETRNKVLYVNGEPIARSPIPEDSRESLEKDLLDSRIPPEQVEMFLEKIGDRNATVILDRRSYFRADFEPITIPEGKYFVMGDNRDNSNDSREWGFVPMDAIRGRALFIWLSVWLDFGSGEYKFRPSRIGTVLE